MKNNKYINREGQAAEKIFKNRSLDQDYRTLKPLLETGMKVLDIGCGTGAISKDIVLLLGDAGRVLGIDNTEKFIKIGKESYKSHANLELQHVDLFDFYTEEKFDLIVSARTLQWLSRPKDALLKMKAMLKPQGLISILDYNHSKIEWQPEPPESMKLFYDIFLKWRSDAGMNNQMADDLPEIMKEIGFKSVEIINADEHYNRSCPNFEEKLGIWSQVAGSLQMVEEGYLENDLRLKAITDYNAWIEKTAASMTMKLNDVQAINAAF